MMMMGGRSSVSVRGGCSKMIESSVATQREKEENQVLMEKGKV